MSKKAQNVTEYAICLAAVIVALSLMQHYVRRGVQGRIADVVDFATASVEDDNSYRQYEPYYVEEEYEIAQDADLSVHIRSGGEHRKVINSDTTTRDGETTMRINCYDRE